MADLVYVIEARNGLVKIGCSSRPRTRLNQTRLHSPILVRLVAMWPTRRREELELHARFDALREHKEWFRVEGDLVDFLQEVWGRGVETIPEWSDLSFHTADGKCRLHVERSIAARKRWSDPDWRARWHESQRRHARIAQPEQAA